MCRHAYLVGLDLLHHHVGGWPAGRIGDSSEDQLLVVVVVHDADANACRSGHGHTNGHGQKTMNQPVGKRLSQGTHSCLVYTSQFYELAGFVCVPCYRHGGDDGTGNCHKESNCEGRKGRQKGRRHDIIHKVIMPLRRPPCASSPP